MRVLVVGAGGVGGYFGGRLLEAGRDVTFLVRPRRQAQIAKDGLVIKSPHGDAALRAPTVLAAEILAPWDLIVLSCKAYDLDNAIENFAPAVGPQTMILPLLNGMSHLDRLDARFGAGQVLGGLCAIAATLDPAGHVLHMSDFHKLAFGERDGSDSPRIRAVEDLFSGIKASVRKSADIVQEMWDKWVFLSTLAGATCLFRASVGDIATAGGSKTVLALLAEVEAIARSAGQGPKPEVMHGTRELLIDPASPLTASMLRDLEKGGAVESDHIIGDLLTRAGRASLAAPLLDLVFTHLKAYEARQKRQPAAK